MVPVRTTVEIAEGVRVELLFTPRLSMYQEHFGALPELPNGTDFLKVMERYADIFFFAALNAWELDGHGTIDDFPHRRGDFHGWMTADPKGFGDAVKFAVRALTGKTEAQLLKEQEKTPENAQKQQEEVKKKRGWIYRLMHPSKNSS